MKSIYDYTMFKYLNIIFSMFLVLNSAIAVAQQQDVSDSLWSIVFPVAKGNDIHFGKVFVWDQTDTLLSQIVSNIGTVPIRIDSITISGSNSQDFKLVSINLPSTLQSGKSLSAVLGFRPSSSGNKNSNMNIYTQCDTLHYQISGSAVDPQIFVNHDAIDFGKIMVGGHRDSLINAIVKNVGTSDLTIWKIEITGPDASHFEILSSYGSFILAPFESCSIHIRYSPDSIGFSNCILLFHHDAKDNRSTINMRGEGAILPMSMTIRVDTIQGRTGDVISVPILLGESQNLEYSNANDFSTELQLDATILAPIGDTPHGIITDGRRFIKLDHVPITSNSGKILKSLQFIATLGNSEGTSIDLMNSLITDQRISVSAIPGYFRLTDVCRQGGMRLINTKGKLSLNQNCPNPYSTITTINYEIIEKGHTQLYVMNLLGKKLATIVEADLVPGRYEVYFDANALSSGTYYYILQTPTKALYKIMHVLK